jgi:COP9 signalosome complex subunit 7
LNPGNPSLPALDAPQNLKLRQLTLLTLASPFAPPKSTQTQNNLTYASLLAALDLTSSTELESLITTSIYSDLLTARLAPTSTPPAVQILSVAPLRDLRPQSLPALLQILQTWESRCSSVVNDLETQIADIRETASKRAIQERKRQDLVDTLVLTPDKPADNGGRTTRGAGQRLGSKRDLDQHNEGEDDDYEEEYEGMDLDEGIVEGVGGFVGPGSRGGGGGSSRGAKRNRGRGSK